MVVVVIVLHPVDDAILGIDTDVDENGNNDDNDYDSSKSHIF